MLESNQSNLLRLSFGLEFNSDDPIYKVNSRKDTIWWLNHCVGWTDTFSDKRNQWKFENFKWIFHFVLCHRHTYLKLEQGWMIQCPMAFWRTRSFIKAFFDPNNFIASLLSVGANIFCSWFLTHPGLDSLETEFLKRHHLFALDHNFHHYLPRTNLDVFTVPTSSLGVP